MLNYYRIELDEFSKNICSEFDKIMLNSNNFNLEIVFNNNRGKKGNILINKNLSKINFFKLELCKINTFIISDLTNYKENNSLSINNIEKVSILLSFLPHNIKYICIDLLNIEIYPFDINYEKVCNDYDFRLSHFFSKNKNYCLKLELYINFLGINSISELNKYIKLEEVNFNFSSIGYKIGDCLKNIIKNNDNLKTLSFILFNLDKDKLDSPLWFLNVLEEIEKHNLLANIKIILNLDIEKKSYNLNKEELENLFDKLIVENNFNEIKILVNKIKCKKNISLTITTYNYLLDKLFMEFL